MLSSANESETNWVNMPKMVLLTSYSSQMVGENFYVPQTRPNKHAKLY